MLIQKLFVKIILTILWLLFMLPVIIPFIRKSQSKPNDSDMFLYSTFGTYFGSITLAMRIFL